MKAVHQRLTARSKSNFTAKVPSKGNRIPFPIVGIGASAGGLEAFTRLLKHLPADTGLGFVLVQHLDPQHESALTQILSRASLMPVHEVTNNLRVKANHIYVIPPNTSLSIARGVLKLEPRERTRAPARSIDAFFESLAYDQHQGAIGVILSGTATDGTVGLEVIKAEGGITFAQDTSARYESMPRSAIAAGCVDFILSPENIAKELARISKHPIIRGAHAARRHEDGRRTLKRRSHAPEPVGGAPTGIHRAHVRPGEEQAIREQNAFSRILLLLRNHSGVDFSLYKPTTIRRRIARRMVLNKQDTFEEYAGLLRGNTLELNALYSDTLISVTSFFRNPEAFEVLKRKVFPKFLQRRGDESFRVWVLGCSTGQEAYSIAMAFAESTENASRRRKLQMFATDLNEALLEKARHGLYSKSVAEDVSQERLRRFFVEEEGGYRVNKALRETIVFARQNLINDPPFSRMDLISCRNLLIYLEPGLQTRAFPSFHYALKPEGVLWLGGSESIGAFTDLFDPLDKKHKIYSRKAASTPGFHLPVRRERGKRPSEPRLQHASETGLKSGLQRTEPLAGYRAELNAQREADRITVNQFAPPGVLINAELQILQFRGATSFYLEPPTGKATFDVLKMAREGLMLPLRAAIRKAKKENRTARKERVRVRLDGNTRAVNLEVIPLKNLKEHCFLILFEDAEGTQAPRGSLETPRRDQTKRPAREKPVGGASTRNRNARMVSSKEESRRISELEANLAETRDYLQSVQEQHEAANEELQASNEEVQSANEELQSINEELETSKEELESANEELSTVNEEMGNRNAELNRLNSDLGNLQTSTKLAIVLLGRDLTIRRFSAQAEKQLNLLAADVGRPIGSVRHNLVFADVNPRPVSDPPDAVGGITARRGEDGRSLAQRDLEALLREVIDTVHEQEREVQDGDGRWYSLRARSYLTLDNKVDGAVLVLVDIDALKRGEREARVARDYAEAILRTARDPLVVLRADLRVNTANEAFYKLFQTTPAQMKGSSVFELAGGAWRDPLLRASLEDILRRDSSFNDFELTHDFPHIGRRTMLLNARRLDLGDGTPPMILLAIEDVTIRESETRYRRLFEAASDGIIILDAVSQTITAINPFMTELLGCPREELLGKELWQIGLLQDEPASHAAFRELQQKGHVHQSDLPLTTKSGEKREVEFVANAYEEGGKLVIQCNARDISARKQAEKAARESEQQFRNLILMLPVALYTTDREGRITLANKMATELWGRRPEIGRDKWCGSWKIFLPDGTPQPLDQCPMSVSLREGRALRGEELIIERPDGTRSWVLPYPQPMRDESGETIGAVNMLVDITGRKQAEEALRHAAAFDEAVMTNMGEGLYTVDDQGLVTFMNPAAEELFGWSLAELRGRKMHDVTHHHHPDGAPFPAEECAGFQVLKNGETLTDLEDVFIRKDGTFFDVVYSSSPLREGDRITGLVVVFRDITERKRIEAALRQAQNQLAERAGQLERLVAERTTELREANNHLEAFVYSIAHDLRRPVRAMQGLAQTLLEECGPDLEETGRSYAARIEKSARFMDGLLLDLLEFSRMSHVAMPLEPVSIDRVLEEALRHCEAEIQEKQALVEVIPPLPLVHAHAPALGQVLTNLLTNAIKFVAPGIQPNVRIRAEEKGEMIRVWVEDNGIGIPAESQERIFHVFERLHGTAYPGTGIGLTIVRKGAERMGGRAGVESVHGEGSRFWIELAKPRPDESGANS